MAQANLEKLRQDFDEIEMTGTESTEQIVVPRRSMNNEIMSIKDQVSESKAVKGFQQKCDFSIRIERCAVSS